MLTQPTSRTKLKDIFMEIFLATTDKVSKVSKGSIVNSTGHGVAAVSQRILKDIAVIESNIFPESAFGAFLDAIAQRNGIPARFGQLGGSTFLRLVADVGTVYTAGVHNFTGRDGIIFELESDATIGVAAFTYAKVTATTLGDQTNVDPLSINQVTPSPPTGHKYVVNEFAAQNGRDNESDDIFRRRIKEGVNILATGTLSSYEQAFIKINNNVLRIYKGGFTNTGELRIVVSTVNGVDLSASEITDLQNEANEFLSITDQIAGLSIENITYFPIDISLRVQLAGTADSDNVRIDMQARMQKLFDWRSWVFGDTVEFEDLLLAAKQTLGVERVFEGFFTPNADVTPPDLTLPRIRGFLMLDETGAIISDAGGALNPVFYPSAPDFQFAATVLASI